MKFIITICFCLFIVIAKAQTISSAEFFVDVDPGLGNGTAITVPNSATSNFTATIPTTLLSAGFHFACVRTKDSDGKWGLFETRGFYITNAANNVGNIIAAEFFVDADPGVGNGTPITVPSGSTATFLATVPTTSLAAGFHFVAIRTKDADGKWGLFETRGFYISTQTANMGDITNMEYFFDTDPGVGNAMPLSITPSQNISQSFIIPVPIGIGNGQHFVAIRFNDEWGLFDFDTITVSGVVTPLTLLSFTGKKSGTVVYLNWKTTNEINTSHFEIERSKNGIAFEKIGSIISNNTVYDNYYSFIDDKPFNGVNFYRLKQVDKDGKFEYSSIIKLLYNGYGKPLTIYPNPATTLIQLDFSGKEKTVLIAIFDAQGKQVIQTSIQNTSPLKLNVQALPTGKYFLQISDGVINQKGSFIKQ